VDVRGVHETAVSNLVAAGVSSPMDPGTDGGHDRMKRSVSSGTSTQGPQAPLAPASNWVPDAPVEWLGSPGTQHAEVSTVKCSGEMHRTAPGATPTPTSKVARTQRNADALDAVLMAR
jgi:hypothetical protein